MSSKTGAIRAGRAFVELFADDSKLRRGLAQTLVRFKAFGSSLKSIGAKLTGIGATAIAPMAAAAMQFSTAGDALHKMALRTGATSEALSELGFAAGQSGTDIESVEVGMRKLAMLIDDASQGSKTAVSTLSRLGLTFHQLKALTPDKQLELVADRLAGIANPGEKAAAAIDLFGRSGTQLIPLLGQGSRAVVELREQARQLGLTMSTDDAAAAANFNDALGELWSQIKALTLQIGAAIAGPLTEWIRQSHGAIASAINWTKENRNLIATAALAAAGVLAFGVAFTLAGQAITMTAAAVTVATTVFSTIAAVVAVVKAVIIALATATTVAGAAMAAVQLGMMAGAAAAAVTVAWFVKSAVAAHDWSQALGIGRQALSALVDAIGKGDFERAGTIAFETLKLLFAEMVTACLLKWSEIKQAIAETVAAAKDFATFGDGQRVADAISKHQEERRSLRQDLESRRNAVRSYLDAPQPEKTAGESTGPQAVANTEIPTSTIESIDATARQRIVGTISGLSDRMFNDSQDGTWKRLDQIAANTARTADAIKNLRLGMVYTR